MTGLFISLEGPEGAGKSTQGRLLAKTLRGHGFIVLETREPGGTARGEKLREALLDPSTDWSPLAEALIMNAARDAHLREVLQPALARGEIVICDRFAHSTRAYQGGGGQVSMNFLQTLEAAVCARMPDAVLIFDLPPEEGMARARSRGRLDRFEGKGARYHARVAAAFRSYAEQEPDTHLIDAHEDIDAVHQRVMDVLAPYLVRFDGASS